MQLLLKLPEMDATVEDRDGNSPAHLAATEGNLDCLRLLVYHKKQPMDVVAARNNDVSECNSFIVIIILCLRANSILLLF